MTDTEHSTTSGSNEVKPDYADLEHEAKTASNHCSAVIHTI